MPAPVNSFKQKLISHENQFGCWLGLASGYVAEVATTAGFDWLLIDAEHAPNDLPKIVEQLQVVSASKSHPIVRLPIGQTHTVKQVLDAGAQTLLIPMVESAQQATDMVKAMRYPPNGVRGVGSALARSSNFNAIPDYLSTADDQMCLIVQIETRAGVDSLDEILAVEGVDCVFIGPADLSADMGMLGQNDTPEFHEILNQLFKRIRASGKAAGTLALNQHSIASALDSGASFIGVGVDVLLYANAMRELAANPTMNN